MPGPKRQLSAAELAALEHAFAADPSSDAYRPLTEAYLAAARFMEAMVVCKKGVKAHPDDPGAKVLLARVYAEQGKDRKALDELTPLLASFPNFAAGNLLAGQLHYRMGAKPEGEAALRRAAEAAPGDAEVLAALEKHGVVLAPPEPPPPVLTRAAEPAMAPAVTPSPAAVAAAAALGAGRAAPVAPRAAHAERPTPTPPPQPRAGDAYAKQLAEKYGTHTYDLTPSAKGARKKGHKAAILTSVGLAVVLVASLVGWVLVSRAHKVQVEEISRLLKETQELISRDTFSGYRAAAEKSKEILAVDEDSLAGHAFLAYVDAVRFAEHNEGEAVKAEAARHIDAARKLDKHSHLYAAEAILRGASGDAAGAIADLKATLQDETRQTALLTGTLGVLLMHAGDLDGAREWLVRAQKLNPNDVRLAQQTAEQFRRRGEGYEQQALGLYGTALRLEKDHVPSLLGQALVLLDRGLFEQAQKAVTQVLGGGDASPRQQALAYAIRGSLQCAAGKTAEGVADEKKALELDPQSPDLPWLIGRRLLRDGDAAGAAASIQRAVNGDGKRLAFYVDLTRALLATEGGAKKAVEVLQKATSRVGDHPRVSLLLGDAYRVQGDADRARGQYQRAIELGQKAGGSFPDARVALARLLRDQKDVPQALAQLDQALAEYGQGSPGEAALAYLEMAETERSRGARPDVVFPLYVKALERDPASCEALYGAGRLGVEATGKSKDEASQKIRDTAFGRLEGYVRLCPRGAQVDGARRLLEARK